MAAAGHQVLVQYRGVGNPVAFHWKLLWIQWPEFLRIQENHPSTKGKRADLMFLDGRTVCLIGPIWAVKSVDRGFQRALFF